MKFRYFSSKFICTKGTKFERGAIQAGPGIGLDFPFFPLWCKHTYLTDCKLGLQNQLTIQQLKVFLGRLDKKEV